MEMGHLLTALDAHVADQAPAAGQTGILGHLARSGQEFCPQRWVLKVLQGAHMAFREHQQVGRSLGVDVLDDKHLLGLKNALSRQIASSDFAEDTVQWSRPGGVGAGPEIDMRGLPLR